MTRRNQLNRPGFHAAIGDLDVRQPDRARRVALDDPAAEIVAEAKRKVRPDAVSNRSVDQCSSGE